MEVDWDEPLETDLSSKWLSIAQDMRQLHNIRIGRRYTSAAFDYTEVELHTFTDADHLPVNYLCQYLAHQ